MEQNFYKDEFEQMLTDSTEDFRMYPSRKVWHSIYNDLHPDRRWPSLAVCLLLLTAILYIGVSNNNSISKSSRNILAITDQPGTGGRGNQAGSAGSTNDKNADGKVVKGIGKVNSQTSEELPAVIVYSNAIETDISALNSASPILSTDMESAIASNWVNTTAERSRATNAVGNVLRQTNIAALPTQTKPELAGESKDEASEDGLRAMLSGQVHAFTATNVLSSYDESALKMPMQTVQLPAANKSLTPNTQLLSLGERAWVEDHAFHNLRNRSKWKNKLSYEYYLTPSLGYRKLTKNNDYDPANGLLLRTTDNDAINQQAAPNFEAGLQLLIDVSKKVRLKTGLQFNYTNYVTYAHKLDHPAQTTVLMNDFDNNRVVMPVSYNSIYANLPGSNFVRLNNRTNQLSLPVGADYKLAGKNKVKWYMGASVQPSYTISGNAFLIAADNKNFAEDASMLRKFNVASSVETFVSFKTPSGLDINVGPQLRYQLLSTYNDKYSYTEKLYNLGFKIGVTKKL